MTGFIGAYNKYSISAERHIDAVMPYVTGRKVVIQAGGHSGQFPAYLAKYFETVYTWEPVAPNFSELVHNLDVAGVSDKVFPIRGMLGEVSGTGLMSVASGSSRRQPGQPGAYPIYRIDDLHPAACDLIYLDIEGDELPALRGAAATIKKYLPVIVTEERAKFVATGGIKDFLEQFGYEQVGFYCSDLIFKAKGAA